MFNEIKKLKEKGLKKTQVARALNSDSRTIKKYWDMSSEEFETARASFKQRIMGKNMDVYKTDILLWLKEHNDLSAAQVYDWLRERFSDFSMAERTVRDYVATLRKEYNIPKIKTAREYLAVLETPMADQAQVDMGQIKLITSEGKSKKIYLFTMVLSHSRYKFSQWQVSPFTSKDLIRMHNMAFNYFGGLPKTVVYDQDRAMFVDENNGDLILTSEFQKYVGMAGFKIHLCRAYDPESKGKIESVVKFVKNNFARNRMFTSIEEFNQANNEWLIRTGNGKEHSTIKKIPAEVFAIEKQHLLPIPVSLQSFRENDKSILTYSLGKDNTVTYKSNRYQLPKGTYNAKNKEVRVKIGDNIITFFKKENDEILVSYKISKEKGVLLTCFHKPISESSEVLELENDILKHFKNKENIIFFLEMIRKEKPRYLKEQFKKLSEIVSAHPLEFIESALSQFVAKRNSNLSNFQDIILSYGMKIEEEQAKSKASIPAANIPDAMKHISPEVRSASEYQEKLVKNIC